MYFSHSRVASRSRWQDVYRGQIKWRVPLRRTRILRMESRGPCGWRGTYRSGRVVLGEGPYHTIAFCVSLAKCSSVLTILATVRTVYITRSGNVVEGVRRVECLLLTTEQVIHRLDQTGSPHPVERWSTRSLHGIYRPKRSSCVGSLPDQQ